jgi:hypothetical protein
VDADLGSRDAAWGTALIIDEPSFAGGRKRENRRSS